MAVVAELLGAGDADPDRFAAGLELAHMLRVSEALFWSRWNGSEVQPDTLPGSNLTAPESRLRLIEPTVEYLEAMALRDVQIGLPPSLN